MKNPNKPKGETPPPLSRPRYYYKDVYVLYGEKIRKHEEASVYLHDDRVFVHESNGTEAVYNFDNIVGYVCYERDENESSNCDRCR